MTILANMSPMQLTEFNAAVLASGGDGVARGLARLGQNGALTAFVGDSQTAYGVNFTGGVVAKSFYGYSTHVLHLCPQLYSPVLGNAANNPTNQGMNFGVGGETLAQIGARMPGVLASAPALIIGKGGTNDLSAYATGPTVRAATIFATLLNSIILPAHNAGIPIVWGTISPRGGLTTAQRQIKRAFNDLLRALPTQLAGVYVFDSTPFLTDFANTSDRGAPITGYTADGVHYNNVGCYAEARLAIKPIVDKLIPPRLARFVEPGATYDATLNPGGSFLTPAGVESGYFLGTGGTLTAATGFTPSGEIATGWQGKQYSNSGTATATMVCSKGLVPNSTMPLQAATITTTAAAGLAQYGFATNISSSALTLGDWFTASINYAFATPPTGHITLMLNIQLLGVSGNVYDGSAGAGGNFSIPVAVMGADNGRLETPPIQWPAGATGAILNVIEFVDTTPGASVQLSIWNAEVHKVAAP